MPVRSISRPSWRYLWFGVRVLSILVLVLGFWLVWIMHLAKIQREAVAAIENDGGTVLYDWEWDNGHSVPAGQPRAPRWLVARIGVDFFGHVTVVKSRSPSLAQVGRLNRLQVLHVNFLHKNTFTYFDTELESLKGLTNLSTLQLKYVRVSDAELANLEGLANLSTLHLNGTQVSDRGLVHLKGLTRLSRIEVRGTRVSDAGAKELRRALPGLKLVLR